VTELTERLHESMLVRGGAAARLDARQLALGPDDLKFVESLAPLLGDTPRRVKRFVNGLQLLLAMPPVAGSEGDPSERALVAFLAAINAGLPTLFEAIERNPGLTLGALLDEPGFPADELAQLKTWVERRPSWTGLYVSRLQGRVGVISRLSFERESVLV